MVDAPAQSRPLGAGSVRLRAALGASLVVGLALAAGSMAFLGLLDGTLTQEVAATAEQDADLVAARLTDTPRMPLESLNDDERVMQLLDPTGAVVESSEEAEGITLPPVVGVDHSSTVIDEDPHVVVSTDVDLGDAEYELRLARSLEGVTDATAAASSLLLVAVPALVAVVAVTTWLIVGMALRPVERIRREVDAIGASDLQRRVVVPPTSDEISRLASTMNRMLGRLERSHRTQRQFVSDASHELRSPIASIRQYAELAQRHPDKLDDGTLASSVLAESTRLQQLVDSLLLLTRMDERSQPARRQPVDLDDLVLAESRRLRDTTPLQVDATRIEASRARGDEGMLARMLRNVVDNAARHARGRIALAVYPSSAGITIDVDDDGPGIAAADRGRVFDRFVRLDDARARNAGGSGLGLAIVAEIVAAHDGTVAVSESPLGGARLTITLPGS